MSMIGNLLRVTKAELESYLLDSSLLEDRIYNEEAGGNPSLIDIDKSWEGILFLLTGQNLATLNHHLGRVFFSGQTIDKEQDLGYGPGQYLTPEEVKEINVELSAITVEEITKRFDPRRMTELEIYPNAWEGDGILNYLLDYFKEVQVTYSVAARNNEGIIVFLT
jgi:hypothetical protein